MTKKVAVAMSGGVDSGVAAALLVKKGYKCAGFHMQLWREPSFYRRSDTLRVSSYFHPGGVRLLENKYCSTEGLEAARKTCHKLGIPFYVVDFKDIFKKKVVDYFLEEYTADLTPNPCVMCNKFIKFGELLDYVKRLGFDYLATGHYARVIRDTKYAKRNTKNAFRVSHITYHLLQAKDKIKDQSYFLYNLTQRQLAHILFPVGDYTKKQVWEMGKKWKLPVAERSESQEICFFPETDYRPFLRRQIPQKIVSGEVVDTMGRIIGRHFGLPFYTIGQRHGFKINAKRNTQHAPQGVIPPFYVIGKNAKKNQLIVGFGKEAERKEFLVNQINLVNPVKKLRVKGLKVRIRNQGELMKCKIQKLKIILNEPQRGIAPGQAVVFYCDEEVLGGGIISLDKND